MQLPQLFDLIFKNKERAFDKSRWPLLEWVLDLEDGFVKELHDKKLHRFAAIIVTLQYLMQVIFKFFQIKIMENSSKFECFM